MHKYGENRIANGSFENIEGMKAANWGFYNADGSLAGWINEGDVRLELVHDGYQNIATTDGNVMLDMDASPGNVRIGQVLESAIDGVTYTISFDAAESTHGNGLEVYFGGELIAEVTPEYRTMNHYSFEFVGGAGDGSNLFTIGGTGPQDNHGAFLDNIVIAN